MKKLRFPTIIDFDDIVKIDTFTATSMTLADLASVTAQIMPRDLCMVGLED
jgi:hypothetical protein